MGRPRPAKQPFGFLDAHIDTAATHWRSKVVVPVCAMKCNPGFGKETCPRNTGYFVILNTGKQVAIPHMFGRVFVEDPEFTRGSPGRNRLRSRLPSCYAGGDICLENLLVIFERGQNLSGQVHNNTFLFEWNVRADRRPLFGGNGT